MSAATLLLPFLPLLPRQVLLLNFLRPSPEGAASAPGRWNAPAAAFGGSPTGSTWSPA
ncbi:hypothetical protein [Micromonospora rubida]